MGRKGGMYINPKKFGGAGKPCMKEMLQFLGCLSLNNKKDDKCIKYKNLLVSCAEAQYWLVPGGRYDCYPGTYSYVINCEGKAKKSWKNN